MQEQLDAIKISAIYKAFEYLKTQVDSEELALKVALHEFNVTNEQFNLMVLATEEIRLWNN